MDSEDAKATEGVTLSGVVRQGLNSDSTPEKSARMPKVQYAKA